MTDNFELHGRPGAKVRSIAAWDRLRATYDMIVLTLDPISHWPLNDLDPASYGDYDGLIALMEDAIGYWKLNTMETIILASYDVEATSLSPISHWLLNDIDTV